MASLTHLHPCWFFFLSFTKDFMSIQYFSWLEAWTIMIITIVRLWNFQRCYCSWLKSCLYFWLPIKDSNKSSSFPLSVKMYILLGVDSPTKTSKHWKKMHSDIISSEFSIKISTRTKKGMEKNKNLIESSTIG